MARSSFTTVGSSRLCNCIITKNIVRYGWNKRLRALFGSAQLKRIFEQFQSQLDEKILKAMRYVGERFVNKARLNGNYTDRTGTLEVQSGISFF